MDTAVRERQDFATLVRRTLLTLVVTAGLVASGVTAGLQRAEFDLLSWLTAPPVPQVPVTVVGLDDPSLLALGHPPPLPRGLHADLLAAIHDADAAVLGFDLLFSEPQSTEQDGLFAAALRAARQAGLPVVLARARVRVDSSQVDGYVQELVPIFAADALQGAVNLRTDPDGVVRHAPAAPDALWRVLAERGGAAFTAPPNGARLRYYAPETSLPYVHYTQALNARTDLPAGALSGHILLVGQNTPVSGMDQFPTPFTGLSGHTWSGVFIHATALVNALEDHWIVPLPVAVTAITTALTMLGVALLTRRWRPGQALLVTLAAGAAWSALGVIAFIAGRWLDTTPALLALALYYNASTAENYWSQWRRRLQLRGVFSRYVPPAVVDTLAELETPPILGAERRVLSLLFADLAGFTAASEHLSPEALAATLNTYFARVTAVIHAHHGTVDKFIGDAVMAFWNAPIADPQHARHAVECARALQAEMASLRSQWRGTPFATVKLRIGIHTGEAAVGNFGSPQRITYTALGDAVNTASRLEGANKSLGTSILISGATVAALGGALIESLAWVDRMQVAGRSQALDVYTPVDDPELAAHCNQSLRHLQAGALDAARASLDAWKRRAAACCPSLCDVASMHDARLQSLAASPPDAPGAPHPPIDFSRRIAK